MKFKRMIIRRVFLLLLLIASQYIFFSSVVFKIEDIVVEGCEISDPRQIVDCCQFHVGDSYWFDRLFFDESLLPDNSTFKSLDVSLSRGGKAVVTVEDKVPVVCVWLDSAKKWYLADADGDILCPKRSFDKYPCLKLGYTLTALGSVNKGVIASVLDLEPKIKKVTGGDSLFYSVDQCQNFTVYVNFLNRETEILLGNTGSAEPKLKVLGVILKTMRSKGRKLNSVDVRFRLPGVIAYNPNAPLGSPQNPKVSKHKPESVIAEREKTSERGGKASAQTAQTEKAVKAAEPAALADKTGAPRPETGSEAAKAEAGHIADSSESAEKELKIADSFADGASAGGFKAEDLRRQSDTNAAEPVKEKPSALAAAAAPAEKDSEALQPAAPAVKASEAGAPKPVLDPAPHVKSAGSAAAPSRAETVFSADNDFSPIPEAFLPDE
ncbi:hypothetical protein IJT93_10985 [bacterium]|nr:hypothetical protein [bacterium]